MPLVLVPFVAIGVAILALLIALALTMILTPILEGLAREVPVVGGYIGRAIVKVGDYAAGKITAWANAGVKLVVGWFHGLASVFTDFIDATNAYLVELPAQLEHLLHVSVHEVVKAFVNPVRATADAAAADAAAALDKAAGLFSRPLSDFKGIEHGVDLRVDALAHVLRNVDLPDLLHTADADAHAFAGAVDSRVDDLQGYADQEFARLWDQLGKLPLQQLLEGLAASAGLAVLVRTITKEAGLDNAECRAKFKQVCATNPAAWADLLVLAGVAFTWPGLRAMVDVARDFTRELAPAVREVIDGG